MRFNRSYFPYASMFITAIILIGCGDDTAGRIRYDAMTNGDGSVDSTILRDTGRNSDASSGDAGESPGCVMGAGAQHTCARLENGTLWCWGSNGRGQLGLSAEIGSKDEPTQMTTLGNDVGVVALGTWHTCATKTDGSVWCWGDNEDGEIGIGTNGNIIYEPKRVPELNGVIDVSVGDGVSCVLTDKGEVWCWGTNWSGQLGDGTKDPSPDPKRVTDLGQDNAAISVGGVGGVCALKTNGTLYCWGNVGPDTSQAPLSPKAMEAFGNDNAEIDLSNFTVCTRKMDNSLWCTGHNNYAQVTGSGTSDAWYDAPQQITSVPETAAHWSLMGSTSCVQTTANSLYCWGNNDYGQVGDGSKELRTSPVLVSTLQGRVARADGGGWNHMCVREEDGTIWCWGNNNSGQLGDRTQEDSAIPVKVEGIRCPPATLR